MAGESWAREWMEDLAAVWGARPYEQYGCTQRALAWNCPAGAVPDGRRGVLHTLPDHGLYEVVDPSSGKPAVPGEFGELVFTPFFANLSPLVRFATGDGEVGLTFPAFWAMSMRRHMLEYGTRREQVAMVAVKNRRNGVKNDRAQFRKAIDLKEALDSRLVCDPIRVYDCCPATDGAAAVVLGPAEGAGPRAVDLLASVQTTGRARMSDYDELTFFPATVEAARRAYTEAGISPSDLDVVELHDCFTMAEIVDGEDLGLVEKGEGGRAVEAGVTDFGGRVVVNPSGGLLSKGHPVGATGCGQIFEVVRQLRGEHPNQVSGARIGLTHNAGGTQALVSVHVLQGRSSA